MVPNLGVVLAFVNEFDLIPRADQAYVFSLIDLYRSFYGLEPMMKDAIQLENTEVLDRIDKPATSDYTLPPLFFEETDSDTLVDENEEMQENSRQLPISDFHLVGEIVVLRKQFIDQPMCDAGIDSNDTNRPDKVLRATSVPHEDFERLLYYGLETHSRSFYSERTQLILQGRFNNKLRWESD